MQRISLGEGVRLNRMMSQRFFRGFRIKDEGFRVCRLWAKGMRHKVSDYSYDEVQRWGQKNVIEELSRSVTPNAHLKK